MVSSLTRNARAISGVDSPPSARRVSATRASGASAGWQQRKISSRRSSGTTVTGTSAGRGSWRSFSARVRSRRRRSTARLRPVVTSHALGLSGVPSTGQRRAAIANASCAASSATSTSRQNPTNAATTRAHSARNTSSSIRRRRDGPDLDRAAHAQGGDPRGDGERGVQVGGLDEVVAAEHLLGLGERAVGEQQLAVDRAHRGGGVGGREPRAVEHLVVVAQREVLRGDRGPLPRRRGRRRRRVVR